MSLSLHRMTSWWLMSLVFISFSLFCFVVLANKRRFCTVDCCLWSLSSPASSPFSHLVYLSGTGLSWKKAIKQVLLLIFGSVFVGYLFYLVHSEPWCIAQLLLLLEDYAVACSCTNFVAVNRIWACSPKCTEVQGCCCHSCDMVQFMLPEYSSRWESAVTVQNCFRV